MKKGLTKILSAFAIPIALSTCWGYYPIEDVSKNAVPITYKAQITSGNVSYNVKLGIVDKDGKFIDEQSFNIPSCGKDVAKTVYTKKGESVKLWLSGTSYNPATMRIEIDNNFKKVAERDLTASKCVAPYNISGEIQYSIPKK